MSDNLVILKNPIEGYNNRLKTATPSMHFGVNQMRYEKPKERPKKVHQEEAKSEHLETLDNKPTKSTNEPPKAKSTSKTADDQNNELSVVLVLSVISGFVVSKYVS